MRKTRKEWEPRHDIMLREMHAEGATDDVIARETGHCINTVGDQRRAMQLPKNRPGLYAPWIAIPLISRRAIREACDSVPARGRRTRCGTLQSA